VRTLCNRHYFTRMDGEKIYSIGYGSCYNLEASINEDVYENDDGQDDDTSMDTTTAGITFEGNTNSNEKKRVRSSCSFPDRTIKDSSKKQTVSDVSSSMETSDGHAHFYHTPIQPQPSSSELYNSGKGGARTSTAITTC